MDLKKIVIIFVSLFLLSFKILGQEGLTIVDTVKSVRYWRITERTGEIIPGKPDTLLTDFAYRNLVESQSISMSYLGNLGSPMESRIFFDRNDRSNFMFQDSYTNYSTNLGTHNFINTKIPYSRLTYLSAGSQKHKEERLFGDISVNFGKKLNVGLDVDYLYARGVYESQSAKHLEWTFYSSYISDRHQIHAFINPSDYTNAENGGIQDDLYITNPEAIDNKKIPPENIPVNFANTWNGIKGTRYYLNYHYNLGVEKPTGIKNKAGEDSLVFVPVTSIIYTFDYTNKNRKFYSNDTIVDNFYKKVDFLGQDTLLRDSTSYRSMRNTLGLSMREGFSAWAKFDLTAFITQENRKYTLMTKDTLSSDFYNQSSTYIGGEIRKRTGKILSYYAQGQFGLLGYNSGDINISGTIETRIPFLKDTASLQASGYIKNLAPTLYENHFRGKYFWWDNDFNKVKKVYAGGSLDLPHTRTNFSMGVENVYNYIYFDKTAYPKQNPGSIQILSAILRQNFKYRGLHWNNDLAYQTSSNQAIIPLPAFSFYSNVFLQFQIARVLTMQLGGNVTYFTKYLSPTYEPATQQFRLQDETKIGNYPLVNAYLNCHLKQARFFLEFYNLSSNFINNPAYFSLPHYPVNPMMFKLGISTYFNN